MIALYIILGILLLLFLILMIRVRVFFTYTDDALVYVKVLFFKIRLLPKEEKEKKPKKEPPKEKKPEQKKTVRPLICVGFLVLFLTAVYTSGAVFTRTAAAAAVSHPQHCYHCSGRDKRNDQNVLKSQRISPPTVYTAYATIQAMMHWEMTTVRVLSPEFSSLRTAATAATHGV